MKKGRPEPVQVYFSLGSNVGDRRRFLNDALAKLAKQVDVLKISSFYDTEPWGNTDQPRFINLCAGGQTALTAEELLDFIKSIERELGREHVEKWGPREIDIDILFYGRQHIRLPSLEVPHPYLAERAFVLIPLAEIAGSYRHPVLKKTITELAENVDKAEVRRLADE